MALCRVCGTVGLMVALVLLGAVPASAQQQQPPGPDGQGTDYFVTIGARYCPTYADITANRARNNIQESLRDLGANSPYTAGQEVDLDTEEAVQPNCSPLDGWTFTLGNAIAANPVTGPWGSLSVVSGVDGTAATVDSIPRRNNLGQIDANRTVRGATTIELTQAQLNRAPSGNLWVQGGTPTDPVLFDRFADQYGFGALRCATDNYNGDNVEYIRFPTGSRHVYCLAYYVEPPPTSGTIVIRKQVTDPPKATQRFTFAGNISFTPPPDHLFDLAVVNGSIASERFYRAETKATDAPWEVRELVPSGWELTGLSCEQTSSAVTVDQAAASVSIRLVAGDTVTCTFTDALRPPPGTLLLSKLTRGGVGTFGFTVRPHGGGAPVATTSATTTTEGEPAAAESGPIHLQPGTYDVTEHLPQTRAGRWRLTAVNCGAREQEVGARGSHATPPPVTVTITAGKGQACVFENRLVPLGAIAITKVTRGGTGSTSFQITPADNPARQFRQTATTTAENEPARAHGDSSRQLPLGRYVIQETGTTPENNGRWSLEAVVCDGRLRGFAQGELTVTLTREHPRVSCRFIDAFTPAAPPLPPTPDPQPQPRPPGPQPDLVVTKRALSGRVALGNVATFVIEVHNQGEAAAQEVVLSDIPGPRARFVSARPSRGRCDDRTPLICRLGRLDGGERATIRVRMRAVGGPTLVNQAAAGSATPESTLTNNSDRASVRVGRPRVTG